MTSHGEIPGKIYSSISCSVVVLRNSSVHQGWNHNSFPVYTVNKPWLSSPGRLATLHYMGIGRGATGAGALLVFSNCWAK